MNFLRFVLFSGLEFFSLYLLILSVFGFKIRHYIKELLISSGTLTLLSYLLISSGYQSYGIFIQALIVCATFIFVFKESVAYSFFITVLGYLIHTGTQLVLVFVIEKYELFPLDQLSAFSWQGQVVQTATVTIIFAICATLRSVDAFAFTMQRHQEKRKMSNIILVNSSLLSLILMSMFSYFYFAHKTVQSIVSFFIVVLSLATILTIFSFIRNKEEYGAFPYTSTRR